MRKNNFYLKTNNYIIYIFFVILFAICWSQIEDYGVTLDDHIYYQNGLHTYLYSKQLFLSFFNHEIDLEQFRSKVEGWPIVFELFLVFICDIFKIDQIEKIYLTAHRLNFIIFFSSLIIFYKLIQKRFDNIFFSILSIIFFILSPRILAESFYNSRDIFFMSLFIFYTFSGYNFINNKNFSNTIIFAFFTALLINAKVLGIIPFGIFCLLYLYNFSHIKKKFVQERKRMLFYFLFCIFFIYILWPFLWHNPLQNLFFAFKDILKDHESLIIINYYFGNYMPSDAMPWHYRLVWFFITTPIIILLLFIGAIIVLSKKLVIILNKSLNNNYQISSNHFIDLFLFLVLVGSFFTVAEFNKSKFGGWRHLYYLYPIVIYFSIYFIHLLSKISLKTSYKFIIIFIVTLNLAYNLFWIYKNHPHQYVFFNFLSKKYAMKNFDLDWWGVSHKSSLEYILKKDKDPKIKVYAEGFTSLRDSYLYLNQKNKSRIIISDFKNSKYIIDNKKKRIRVNHNLENEDFELFYELIVDGQSISNIHKRKN